MPPDTLAPGCPTSYDRTTGRAPADLPSAGKIMNTACMKRHASLSIGAGGSSVLRIVPVLLVAAALAWGCTYQADTNYYISITQPGGGSTYCPCAPDYITWNSNIPIDQGEVIELSWRSQEGGDWTHIATDRNTGGHSWPSSPCTPGVYEIRVRYTADASVFDIATVTLIDCDYAIAIDTPADGSIYSECGPDTIRWTSDIPSDIGSSLNLYGRVGGGDWQQFAFVPNTGKCLWVGTPCEAGTHGVKIEFNDDPSVYDAVTFFVTNPADAETVRFYVDGQLAATLMSGEQPEARPVVISGKSGPYGDEERSGLCDNVVIRANGGQLIREERFTVLSPLFWEQYGSPSPRLLGDFGHPSPCLMTAGDSSKDSGIYTTDTYDWRDGFLLEIDVYTQEGGYRGIEFGIASADAPADETLNTIIGFEWKYVSDSIVFTTDIDSAEVPLPSFESWHTITISTYLVTP